MIINGGCVKILKKVVMFDFKVCQSIRLESLNNSLLRFDPGYISNTRLDSYRSINLLGADYGQLIIQS
jgi:hypothetical protein